MPASKLVRFGVWENEKFRGVILYGSGANRHLSKPFGLKHTEACDLVRVALVPGRIYPTSKCLAISLKLVSDAGSSNFASPKVDSGVFRDTAHSGPDVGG